MELEGAKRKPKVAKRDPKGAEREPKKSPRETKGSQRNPKGSQNGTKRRQRTTKTDQQINAWTKAAKRRSAGLRMGPILEPFLELKTLKSVVFMWFSYFFVFFGKVENH